MKTISSLVFALFLTGCAAPAFLGDDNATFVARLTCFDLDTAAPGILRAIMTDRGARANGCQLSMRGQVPAGTVATMIVGDSRVDLTDPVVFEQPE